MTFEGKDGEDDGWLEWGFGEAWAVKFVGVGYIRKVYSGVMLKIELPIQLGHSLHDARRRRQAFEGENLISIFEFHDFNLSNSRVHAHCSRMTWMATFCSEFVSGW